MYCMSSELMNPTKRYSLCLDTLQEPGSAKYADRRRMGRNCCTRKPIRSNVDMQSQSEGPEISSSKECKCALISILAVFNLLKGNSYCLWFNFDLLAVLAVVVSNVAYSRVLSNYFAEYSVIITDINNGQNPQK